MIKARLETDIGPILLIGLSDGNLQRLAERKPILFGGEEVGFPDIAQIAIISGETEEKMASEIQEVMVKK